MKVVKVLAVLIIAYSECVQGLTRKSVVALTDWSVTPTVTYTQTLFSSGINEDSPSLFLAGANVDFGAGVTPNFSQAPYNIPATLLKQTQGYELARLVLDEDERAQIVPLAGTALAALQVTNLALVDSQYPVVAVTDNTNKAPQIMMLTNTSVGGTFTAGAIPNDAAGDPITDPIAGLVAGKFAYDALSVPGDFIFVAVPEAGKAFTDGGADKRGIAILQKTITTAAASSDTSESTDTAAASTATSTTALAVLSPKELKNTTIESPAATQLKLGVGSKIFSFTDLSDANHAEEGSPQASDDSQDNEDAIIPNEAVIGSGTAVPGSGAQLWWDNDLQRLYIGLQSVTRDDNTKSMGILGLAMGYIDTKVGALPQAEFKIAPIVVNPIKSMFYENPGNRNIVSRGIGFYYDGIEANRGQDNVQVSIPFIRSMHTSTDKYYLILQSVIAGSTSPGQGASAPNYLMALPLISNSGNPAAKGTIAAVDSKTFIPLYNETQPADNQFTIPTKLLDLPPCDAGPVKIGSNGPIIMNNIQDIFVAGDVVYVACSGKTIKERGIFCSSALFNQDGFICGWTPWVRVMGDAIDVKGAGLDQNTGNFYMLTSASDDNSATQNVFNTGSVSVWGKGATFITSDQSNNPSHISVPLSRVLAEKFPQSSGGIYQIYPFDTTTPGFAAQGFTMLVAVGNSTISLIETSKQQGTDLFQDYDFIEGENVFTFTSAELTKISSLIGAEIQVDANPVTSMKLFVYGCGGIVTMTLNPNKLTLKDALAAQGLYQSFVSDIKTPVYNVVRAEDFKLAALTDDGVYVLPFDGQLTGPLSQYLEAHSVGGSSLVSVAPRDLLTSTKAVLIEGTDNGLVVLRGSALTKNVPGQIMQMFYLSPGKVGANHFQGLEQPNGMLYVLTFAPRLLEDGETANPLVGKQVPQIYRLSLSNDTLMIIDKKRDGSPRPFIQFDDFRTNFATDGSVLFNISPRDGGMVDFLRVTAIPNGPMLSRSMLNDQQSLQEELDLDQASKHFHVGIVKRDPGSGSLMVPGDWGLRVND